MGIFQTGLRKVLLSPSLGRPLSVPDRGHAEVVQIFKIKLTQLYSISSFWSIVINHRNRDVQGHGVCRTTKKILLYLHFH